MDDSPRSAVELRIKEDWYWWSGYPRDPDYPSLETKFPAETDGPKFYTKTAFPSLKPDIDIFGVPRRSRKQRGWHQVAVPSLGRHSERVGKRAHFRAPAKPSDIPPELFDGILEHLLEHGNRHDRVICASVCRHWNEKCQPRLFDRLGLRSREDGLPLLEFMRTPTSAVSSLVERVYIRQAQAVSGTPWLHLMSTIGDLAHKELGWYDVSLKGPLPAGQRMRSIHHRLPRSLPGHFSRHIEWLTLTEVHFNKLDDLMHLVGELPDLYRLECERVTWGSLPTALPRRRPRNESQEDKYIKMSKCGPRPEEALVWLAASLRPRDQAFFFPDDLTLIASIARGLESVASTSVKAHTDKQFFGIYLGDCPSLWRRDHRPSIWRRDHRPHVLFYDRRRDPSSPLQERRIDSIVLDIRKPEGPDMAGSSEPDWTIVGRTLSSFPALERMTVGLDSREDMVRFEEQVVQVHLRRLSSSGMLRYALWDTTADDQYGYKYGTWLRASTNSDDTECSGWGDWDLHKVYDEQDKHIDEDS